MGTPTSSQEASVPDAILSILQSIHDDVQDVKKTQKEMGETLTDHINTEPQEWADQLTLMMKSAFPNGDPDGHRKAHEDEMATIAARAEFWKKMLFEVSKYGVIGVVGWLAYTIWVAFLQGPSK